MIIIIIISVIIALSRFKVGLPALCSGRKIYISVNSLLYFW